MRMRVLLLGEETLLGQALLSRAAAEFIQVETVRRPEQGWLPDMVDILLDEASPDLVLNLAFYHEQFQLGLAGEPELQAQRRFEERLTGACAARNLTLVMLSSVRVFDGAKGSAYTEKDEAVAVGALGQLQADMEQQVRSQCPQHVILRFSWLLDGSADGVFGQLVSRIRQAKPMQLAEEWRGNPTPVDDAARVILSVIKQLDCAAPLYGTYHYGSGETATWISFALSVAQELMSRGEITADPQIQPAAFESQPMYGQQPQNGALLGRKLLMVFGIKPRAWRSQLPALLDSLKP